MNKITHVKPRCSSEAAIRLHGRPIGRDLSATDDNIHWEFDFECLSADNETHDLKKYQMTDWNAMKLVVWTANKQDQGDQRRDN
jgi:hypothetical protein